MIGRKSKIAALVLLVALSAGSVGAMEIGTNFWNVQWGNAWQDYFVSGVNWSTTTNPWRADLLTDLQPYTVIRYMDWVPTNTSTVRYWSERISKTANHYSTSGVAYEWQIDLCNRAGADLWITVPHLTVEDYEANPTNNYWVSLANLVKQQLDPNLNVYVEYSNETWNTGFGQGTYCQNRGLAMGLDPDGYTAAFKFHVYAALRLHRVFTDVFSDQPWRIKKVIAGHAGSGWGADKNWGCYAQILALQSPSINPWGLVPDYYSIAPYAGGGLNGASATIRTEWTASVAESVQQINAVRNTMAQHYGTILPLALYESGQSVTTNGDVFARNPQSYDMYIEYLNAIDDNVVVAAHYTHTGTWASGGDWGAKESTWQTLADAHKYRAIRDYWLTHQGPPSPATNPSPANGAPSVSIFADLSWAAGAGATSHDVYFGTVSPPPSIGNQAGSTYDPGTLNNSTTYYWRIDEKNSYGTTTGTQWSFTTEAVTPPPAPASSPTPANGATSVSTTQGLSWTAGSGATSHDVYFGTVSPGTSRGNQTATSYNPGTLALNTTYYWRIDERNPVGVTTGSVWSFSTAAPDATIFGASTAPVIDGAVDAVWGDAQSFSVANVLSGTFSGPADLSGTWRALWDSGYIYYLLEVTDDAKRNDSTDAWDDDSAEIYLDPDYSRGGSYDGVNDYQLVFRWNDPTLRLGVNSATNTTGMTFVIVDTPSGYTLEARLPWATLGVTPSIGMRVGADIHIEDDDDGGSRDGKKAWYATADNSWVIPSTFATAVLAAPPAPVPPGQAHNPNPGDGATETSVNAILTWMAGSGATSHDVYIGIDPCQVAAADNDSPLFKGNQAGATYNGSFAPNISYYWRIDEKNDYGTTTGNIWSFTTANRLDIVFDAVSSANSTASGPTLTWQHTIGGGSDRGLVIGTQAEDTTVGDTNVVSITYAGLPLTKAGSRLVGTSTLLSTELWYALEANLPAAGTYNVIVTYSGTVTNYTAGAISVTNARQTPPEDVNTAAVASGSGSTNILTRVNASIGAWVIDSVGCGNERTEFAPVTAGMVERYQRTSTNPQYGNTGAGSTRQITAAGTATVEWNNNTVNRLSQVAASFAPAEGSVLIGDLDLDGDVDIYDVGIFTEQWLWTGDCSAEPDCADIDDSSRVDFVDFALLGGSY